MRVVVLAGGAGTRIRPRAGERPKALVEIGGRPILWHVLRYYAHFGHREFVVALGHKGGAIRDWALSERWDWDLELVDTGETTGSGGRLARLRSRLGSRFMLTWCDGLADVDLAALARFHEERGRLATVTAVHPPPRFGCLELADDRVERFEEKPQDPDHWINGAFFVLEPEALGYVENDATPWEGAPMERLTRDGQLSAFRHEGFWQCMDTPDEHDRLEALWSSGCAPWKRW